MEKSALPAPHLPKRMPQLDPPRDRITIKFLGVHIEGVGRGVNRVLTALMIVGAVLIAIVILGHVL